MNGDHARLVIIIERFVYVGGTPNMHGTPCHRG